MTAGERVGRVVLAATAVLGVVTMLAVAASLTFGLRPVIIQSGSMEPDITTGTLLLTHPRAAQDVQVGDVVTVPLAAGGHVTHRVLSTSAVGGGSVALRLKGDANPIPDELPVTVRRVDAAWFGVPVVGSVIAWFSRSPGVLVAAGLVAVLVSVALRRDVEPVRVASTTDAVGPRRTRRRWRPVGLRCSRRRTVVRLTILTFALGITPAAAAWNDTATASGTQLTAASIKPIETATTPCVTNNVNRTVTTRWNLSTVPGVTYSARLTQTGAPLLVSQSGSEMSTFMYYEQAATTGAQTTVYIEVTATKGNWTSVSTRAVQFNAARTVFTCQAWT